MSTQHLYRGALAVTVALLFSQQTSAQIIASDNASDPAYAEGWFVGTDGGAGFSEWLGSGSYGTESIMEIDVDSPEPDNDLGGPAFRIASGGGPSAGYAINRYFDVPMQAGQTFKIDYDAYPIKPTEVDQKGRDILIGFESAGGERFSLYGYYYNDFGFEFGSEFWGLNAATANNNLAGGASLPDDPLNGINWRTPYSTADASDGFTLILDLVTIDTYRVRIIDDNVTKLDVSGQLFNEPEVAGQGLERIVLYGSETSAGSTPPGAVLYFNNMSISVTDAGVAGDFDGDGDVDGADFLLWQRGGSPNPLSQADLATWRNNFGAAAATVSASVPEPSSAMLAALAVLSGGVLMCTRKK